MSAAAISGDLVQFRTVQGRGVLQIIVEIPLEDGDHAHAALGGYPKPGESRPVAIALLDPAQARAKPAKATKPAAATKPAPAVREPRAWPSMAPSQQAGLLCNDPEFMAWAGATTPGSAADFVRLHCGIASRAQLDRNPQAAAVWQEMVKEFREGRALLRDPNDRASQEAAYRRAAK